MPRKTIKEQIKEQMPKVDVGIAVAVPNTNEQKMDAICDLANAVSMLARALCSVNTKIEISDCHINNVNKAIDISTEK